MKRRITTKDRIRLLADALEMQYFVLMDAIFFALFFSLSIASASMDLHGLAKTAALLTIPIWCVSFFQLMVMLKLKHKAIKDTHRAPTYRRRIRR